MEVREHWFCLFTRSGMHGTAPEDAKQRKISIREQAHVNRNQQADKDDLSRRICLDFMALPEYAAARTVMFYVDARSEVRTRHMLPDALRSAKRIVVPYCVNNELELFLLSHMDELMVGMYKILEPRPGLRDLPERRVGPGDLDLVMVPGVAFDKTGGRMGHGFGYYDKLLQNVRRDASLVALAFECQLFPEIPTQAHDIFMDKIITEKGIYTGKGRGRDAHL
jgi:5-formyltetrahydrofolate cyclo-ligase